jgi:hypothetical protein
MILRGPSSKIKSTKGTAMLEMVFLVFFILGFVIWSTTSAIAILDTSRDGRTAGIAADMVRQLFEENSNPTHEDMARVVDILEDTGYFRQNEDFRLIVTVYQNHWFWGHVRSGISAQGPNTTAISKITTYGAQWETPGIEISGDIYELDANELMYAVEIYSGQRGKTNSTSGTPPFYEYAVLIHEP